MSHSTSNRQARFGAHEREFVLGVVMKLLRDREKAEDAAQEAMLLAFRHRASYRGDAAFTTWLYRIAQTTALMHLRKQRRSIDVQLDELKVEAYDSVPTPGLDPEAQVLVAEEVAIAGQSLAKMGQRYGQVVKMRFADGYSASEIGEELGLNEATVKSRVHRGRAVLRDAIGRRRSALRSAPGSVG
jgi:RNA polymerase sigma-70 factor (ECF subfamily)